MVSKAQHRANIDARILAAWAEVDDTFPDKSTPWVASMVAEQCAVDCGRVFDALARETKAKAPTGDRPHD